MLFHSLSFAAFFVVIVLLYYVLPAKFRWVLLLLGSYFFYMCWRPEYAVLILLSTVVDYLAALQMEKEQHKTGRKKWLFLSLFVNLGLLFTFKYYNFFSSSLTGFGLQLPLMEFLLPVGISFYTFQTLSYTIEVYQGNIKAERHLGYFALYVSFFPQLVAGPIERPQRLLPQLKQTFAFDYERVVKGLKMMAWGFFLKLVIADRLAPVVDGVYNSPTDFIGLQVILATIFFAFQIFGDFAGYSLIAIGTAKVLGYELMENFRRPYLATSLRDFWNRWHISLSSWFRDYVYIPLGGNRTVKWKWSYNILLTFLLSGLWHGANWTFLIWGALHGIYLLIERMISKPDRSKSNQPTSFSLVKCFQIILTFFLVCVAWVFFRANTVAEAFMLLKASFQIRPEQFDLTLFRSTSATELLLCLFLICFLMISQLRQEFEWGRNWLFERESPLRWVVYILLVVAIIGFGVYGKREFIYFQF